MARTLRHAAIADAIRRRLGEGEYPPGQLLPSEAAIADEHAVSRVTVRTALAQLKSEGLIDSRQGFGWYAVGAPVRHSLALLTTIEEQIAAAGRASRRRILTFAFGEAPARIAQVLGDAVLEITRLNLADEHPLARVTVWVPEALASDLSRRAVEERPLYELLGVGLGGATQTIGAVGASRSDARLLKVREGSPLLWCERTTSDVGGQPVLVSDAVFNPLLTEFVADLPAGEGAEPTGLRLVR